MNAIQSIPAPSTKNCLDCSTQIPVGAKKCPHCREWQTEEKRNGFKTAFRKTLDWLFTALMVGFVAYIIIMTYVRDRATDELRNRKDSFLSSTASNRVREVINSRNGAPVFLEVQFNGLWQKSGTFAVESTIAVPNDEFVAIIADFCQRHAVGILNDDYVIIKKSVGGLFEVRRKLVVAFPKT